MTPLTKAQKAVLDLLTDAAEHGLPCPTNAEICIAAGSVSLASGTSFLSRLVTGGLIQVERRFPMRIVTITATGKRTSDDIQHPQWAAAMGGEAKRRQRVQEDISRRASASLEAKEAALRKAVVRDPCFACGVPYDRHDAQGCKRWVMRG